MTEIGTILRFSSLAVVVQDGIANPGGTQLGMLGGAPAPPRPPPSLPPSAIRTATDVIMVIIHGDHPWMIIHG